MTQTTKIPKTFEEYLRYNDDTDKKYEFVGGELVEMPPESPLNSRISFFLALQFAKKFETSCPLTFLSVLATLLSTHGFV
ncbi:Uma2 family endonuclease [Scytonema sp. UIC 10036]|uniref:Uma2 family endonuclease n=1 Tax=Scytonema sp. UIC 10036 TaxID=2304196 RepID=UPI001FA9EFF3|nr:Uma2 family endonuclease [Scytonema sp. UIC 10036]